MDVSSSFVVRSIKQYVIGKWFSFLCSFSLLAIDPTKMNKPRQFARTTAPARAVDSSLWTETPAERQQRLADEVAGKRRRAEEQEVDLAERGGDARERERKRRRDEEIRAGVDEYTVCLSTLQC